VPLGFSRVFVAKISHLFRQFFTDPKVWSCTPRRIPQQEQEREFTAEVGTTGFKYQHTRQLFLRVFPLSSIFAAPAINPPLSTTCQKLLSPRDSKDGATLPENNNP
jgi:hypothetical protein